MQKAKISIKILSFILIFLYLFVHITYVLRADSDMKQRFAGFYSEPEHSLDVIYIGSSPVHPYWAAPLAWNLHGFTSLPLATNVQEPKAALFLLKEALKEQNPKVVVFELRMFTRPQEVFDTSENDAFRRNVTDNLKISRNRYEVINSVVPEKKRRIEYYFDLIKYHTLWKNIDKSEWAYWNFEKEDSNKGHLIRPDVMDLSEAWHDYSDIEEKLPIPQEQEIHLRKLLDYCKQHNITALFTVNPYTDITEDVQKQFNYMEEIVVNEYEFRFLNFNGLYNELDIDFQKDFYNGGHMNINGAEKFTGYLSEYLSAQYGLEDKRGDEKQERWNQSYQVWRKNADQAIQIIDEKVKEGNYD